jgi:hypothetical protein
MKQSYIHFFNRHPIVVIDIENLKTLDKADRTLPYFRMADGNKTLTAILPDSLGQVLRILS